MYKKVIIIALLSVGSLLPGVFPAMQTVNVGKTTMVLTSHHERSQADAAIVAMPSSVVTAQKMIDKNIMPLKLFIVNDGDQPIAVGIDGIQGIPVIKSADMAKLFWKMPFLYKMGWGLMGGVTAFSGALTLGGICALLDARTRRDVPLFRRKILLPVLGVFTVACAVTLQRMYHNAKKIMVAGNEDLLQLVALNEWQEVLPGQKMEKLIFVPCSNEDRQMHVTILAKQHESVERLKAQFTVPALEMQLLPTVYH